MLFNSYEYLLFFPIVCLVYYLLPKRSLRNFWLLLASNFFYGSWNARYLVLIWFSILSTWICSLMLERTQKTGLRKFLVGINAAVNLGILFVFKYFNLFASTANQLGASIPLLDLLLPVGISFYTFQALGYTIDVYRGTVPAEKNLMIYSTFITFFPQLVAGPIERASNLLPQFHSDHHPEYERIRMGLLLMLWGFFLKLVLADRAAQVVNHIYNGPDASGFLYLIGTICFSLQIYGDFAGYSMIALGSAEVMGFSLMRNFRQPYLSRSVSEFWRRWHISLNDWFKEYVYYPLGGNRKGTTRTFLNLMIVFVISGLWHGSAYTFVLWGVMNGLFQIIERSLHVEKRKKAAGIKALGYIVLTYCLVMLTWVPFRAQSIGEALHIYSRIFSLSILPGRELIGQTLLHFGISKYEVIALMLSAIIVMLVDCLENRQPGLAGRIEQKSLLVRWPVYYVLLFAVLIFGVYGSVFGAESFLYFQF